MRRNYGLIITALLISLFVYLFYRTDKTVINELFISLVSFDMYEEWRQCVIYKLPLHDLMVYSLPEGLWVFSATLTSKYFHIRMVSMNVALVFTPLVFSIGLEFFQLLHLTNGRFDWWDIVLSVFFWAIAFHKPNYPGKTANILKPVSVDSLVCFSSYLIVYFAHVWK